MNYYSTQITNLIEELRRLPGIGSKSAQRLAFHIINMPEEHVHHLAQTLVTAREKIQKYALYVPAPKEITVRSWSWSIHRT